MTKKKNNGAAQVESDAADAADALTLSLKEWEQPGQMTGTACKCGAHTNARWEAGGKEWLSAHVLEVHPTAFDWPAAIRKALAMADALEGMAYLETLVKHDDEKESLADA